MAIACLRLVTLPPLPAFPDLSVPCFFRRMALATVFPAALLYLRLDFFFAGMRILLPLRRKCRLRGCAETPACVALAAYSSGKVGSNVVLCLRNKGLGKFKAMNESDEHEAGHSAKSCHPSGGNRREFLQLQD
jgi:hypothetical protein